MPVPDCSHVEEFKKHPTGRHAFIVKSAVEMVRQSDGADIAKIILQPIGHDADNRPDMMVQFTLEEKYLFKLRPFIECCGLPVNGNYDWERFVGKKVIGYVAHNDSKGKTYANVNEWEAFDEGAESRPGLGTVNTTQTDAEPF